jgi:polar amino acid transport system substrate-binding protein
VIRIVLGLWIFCLGFGLTVARAQDLTVAVADLQPRYGAILGESGVQVPIVEEVLALAALKPTIVSLPIGRIFAGLRDGSIDVWLGPKSPVLEGAVSTAGALGHIQAVAYSIRSPAIAGVADLAGHSVITIQSYTFGELGAALLADPRIEVSRAHTHEDALRMLIEGRADYLIDYSFAVDYLRPVLNLPPMTSTVLSSATMELLVANRSPRAVELMKRLSAAVRVFEDAHRITD